MNAVKTGFISDLHIDINEAYPIMDLLEQECRERQLELLLIAGDISETPEKTISAVRALQEKLAEASCRVYYVPGNHDMWNINCPDKDTDEIESAYEQDPLCLSGGKVVRAGSCAVIGDIGWYDYSFADPEYDREKLDSMEHLGRTWQDKFYNSWTKDNPAAMRKSLDRPRGSLETAGSMYGADMPVIAVTHMLPIREFTVLDATKEWAFFNSFLGGTALADLFLKYPVRISVSGHVHYRKQLEKDGILWICPCLGYHSEWPLYKLKDNDAKTHIADALQVLDL